MRIRWCLLLLLASLASQTADGHAGDRILAYGQQGQTAPLKYQGESIGPVALQPLADNSVLVLARCDSNTAACIVKVDARGDVDPTYGTLPGHGTKIAPPLTTLIPLASNLVADGSLLVASSCEVENGQLGACVAKLKGNGAIDRTYGLNGLLSLGPVGAYKSLKKFHFLSNGAVLAFFVCSNIVGSGPATVELCAQRITPNGNLDVGFGVSGVLTIAGERLLNSELSVADVPNGVAVASNCASVTGLSESCIIYITPNGTLDRSAGSGSGVVRPQFTRPNPLGFSSKYTIMSMETSSGRLDMVVQVNEIGFRTNNTYPLLANLADARPQTTSPILALTGRNSYFSFPRISDDFGNTYLKVTSVRPTTAVGFGLSRLGASGYLDVGFQYRASLSLPGLAFQGSMARLPDKSLLVTALKADDYATTLLVKLDTQTALSPGGGTKTATV
jgi:hypothetical protein